MYVRACVFVVSANRNCLFWVPEHAGIRGNEIADGLGRDGNGLRFLGPEPALGFSRRGLQKRLGR